MEQELKHESILLDSINAVINSKNERLKAINEDERFYTTRSISKIGENIGLSSRETQKAFSNLLKDGKIFYKEAHNIKSIDLNTGEIHKAKRIYTDKEKFIEDLKQLEKNYEHRLLKNIERIGGNFADFRDLTGEEIGIMAFVNFAKENKAFCEIPKSKISKLSKTPIEKIDEAINSLKDKKMLYELSVPLEKPYEIEKDGEVIKVNSRKIFTDNVEYFAVMYNQILRKDLNQTNQIEPQELTDKQNPFLDKINNKSNSNDLGR